MGYCSGMYLECTPYRDLTLTYMAGVEASEKLDSV